MRLRVLGRLGAICAIVWNQDGCLGRVGADGQGAQCLDEGARSFGGVRVDDDAVYYLKDGEVWKIVK